MQSPQDELARKIALFFLFSLTDEPSALHAAHKSIAQFKASAAHSSQLDAASIRILKKIYDKHKAQHPRDANAPAPREPWNIRPKISVEAWMRFRRNATDEEAIALVLSRIVGASDTEIAQGLGVSIGTVRYRVGKALKQLGGFVDKGASA